MVEIYNETIHDLLSSKLATLEIRAQGAKITLSPDPQTLSHDLRLSRQDQAEPRSPDPDPRFQDYALLER